MTLEGQAMTRYMLKNNTKNKSEKMNILSMRTKFPNKLMICALTVMAAFASVQNAKAEEDAFWKQQHVRSNWVYATLKQDEVLPLLERTLKDQQRWADLPENAPDSFRCVTLQIAPPSADALTAFNKAEAMPHGIDADTAYAQSASLGYWRAAARLIDHSLDDEYWEGAEPAIAWLLTQHIPAGYNKLADVLEISSGYDGETPDNGTLNQVASLRWRAAREGDPVAQIKMVNIFNKLGKPDIAASLRACAIQQNPKLAQ